MVISPWTAILPVLFGRCRTKSYSRAWLSRVLSAFSARHGSCKAQLSVASAEGQPERRPSRRQALDRDLRPERLDDPPHHRQPEAAGNLAKHFVEVERASHPKAHLRE